MGVSPPPGLENASHQMGPLAMKDRDVVPVVTSIPIVRNKNTNDLEVKSYRTKLVENKEIGDMVRKRKRECSVGKS